MSTAKKGLTAEEIRLRGTMLASNKELLRLHRQLVMSGLITEEEFWATRQGLLESQEVLLRQKRSPQVSLGPAVKGSVDIAGDLKFVLTPALIQSIFDQHPQVRRAHGDLVPERLDEKAFWMQYFTSRFFKEGLNSAPAGARPAVADPKEGNLLDGYYEESVEEDLAVDGIRDSLPLSIDIQATLEDHFASQDPFDGRKPSEATDPARSTIKKFNKLSLGVVETAGLARFGVSPEEELDDPSLHKAEDLCSPRDLLPVTVLGQAPSMVPAKRTAGADDGAALEANLADTFCQELQAYATGAHEAPVRLMSYADYQSFCQQHPLSLIESTSSSAVPEALADEARALVANTTEILRQFWSAYPPQKDAERRDKCRRMASILGQLMERHSQLASAAATPAEQAQLVSSFEAIVRASSHAVNLARNIK